MFALNHAVVPHTLCGNYAAAAAQAQELVGLAEEKGSLSWKANGMIRQGSVLARRQGFGRDRNVDVRDHCLSDNWTNSLDAISFVALGTRPRGARAIR